MTTALEKANGTPVASDEPRFDPVALAEAAAIRARTEAETEAARIKAEAEADAIRTKAAEEAEQKRIANERARMKLQKDQAAHDAYLAEKAAKEAAAKAAADKAEKASAEAAEQEAARAKEQQRSEAMWRWGARAIYAVGLIIAAPVQFLAFWDEERPFLVAAPALLEGLALVLACGAAWAVAHRRDVMPYRIGIMLGALIAAGINLWHGLTDPVIGLNAGLIGAIASIGGPIVLMAYEHGIAQKADGIPSYRERRASEKQAKAEAEEKARAKREREDAAKKAAAEKQAQRLAAEAEQQRRDADRKQHHPDVWKVAESLRSARGAACVTEQIWGDAWYLVTGSKRVGIDAEIEAAARAAQTRMKTATEVPIFGEFAQLSSQKDPGENRDPKTPDGRRHNGGTPPRRRPGQTAPYSPIAKKQAALEQTAKTGTANANH